MKELFSYLTSPVWWVTVVIFGIIINLISSYLKPFLDKLLSQIWESYLERSNLKSESKIKQIEELSKNHHSQLMTGLYALSLRIHGAFVMLVGVSFFFIVDKLKTNSQYASIFLLGIGAFFAFYGFIASAQGSQAEKMLNKARRIEDLRDKK